MILIRTLILRILIIIFLCCPSMMNAMHDYDPFINVGLLKDFNKNFSIKANCEYERYSNTRGNYLHNEIGGIYKISPKYIDSNFTYRVISYTYPNLKKMEQRLYFNINFKNQINKFGVSDQVGFEYRERQKCSDVLFLKNQLTLNFELQKSGKSSIKPYVSDTLFYDINKKDSHRNIFSIGFVSNRNNELSIDFYYYLLSYFKRFNESLKYEHYYGIQFTFLIPEIKHKTPVKRNLFNKKLNF